MVATLNQGDTRLAKDVESLSDSIVAELKASGFF